MTPILPHPPRPSFRVCLDVMRFVTAFAINTESSSPELVNSPTVCYENCPTIATRIAQLMLRELPKNVARISQLLLRELPNYCYENWAIIATRIGQLLLRELGNHCYENCPNIATRIAQCCYENCSMLLRELPNVTTRIGRSSLRELQNYRRISRILSQKPINVVFCDN
jgi:hypothetical protein